MIHCDDVIDDPRFPAVLRDFLRHCRAPAVAQLGKPKPICWATHEGKAVRLCMASRLGDVGINESGADFGYSKRVGLDALTDFRAAPEIA